MPSPSTTDEFLVLVSKSELIPKGRLEEYVNRKQAERTVPATPVKMALALIHDGLLTKYQAEQLLVGRWRNFMVGGKYKLLERIGNGGMAMVFLCEHLVMKRLVALKILPTAHCQDKELLGRFHREARALSSLRHPNIVGAYDADRADQIHFLVMEYVDGADLDQLIQKVGRLSWERAADYICQAAHGLQHAHECGLVHRDMKPGNLLLDRSGTIKLLDLGLARIFHESTDDLTTGRDVQTLLGTVDYLAPEQALNSHDVDIRADIYGLGATFYFLLTAKGLFEDGSVAEKLAWHLHRPPVPISEARPDVPVGLIRVIDRMLAKKPDDRYQTPDEVIEALEPWTRTPVAPPDPSEFTQLSKAARSLAQPSSNRLNISSTRPIGSNSRRPAATSKGNQDTEVMQDGGSTSTAREPSRPKQEPTHHDIPPLPKKAEAAPSKRPLRKRLALAGTAAGLLAAGAVVWWAFSEGNAGFNGAIGAKNPRVEPRPSESETNAPTSVGSNNTPPADLEHDATFSLVSESGSSKPFTGLRDAIKAAKAGDRVVVNGSLVVESIELSDVEGVPANLTIEGVVPGSKGQPVRWRGAKGLGPGRPLLEVSGLEGFHLKGFLFDGQGRVTDLVRLSGRGGGSMLEDLQFQGATRAGLVLRGWLGESSRPSTIRKAQFSTSAPSEAALLIEADADRPDLASEAIRVVACRFVGPFSAALLVGGPVEGLEVEQCRFSKATDGLRYRRSEPRAPIRARLANNTFSELQRGIHFETTPRAGSSELVVTNNIFSNTTRAATLDRVSVEPGKTVGRWIWTEEAKKTGVVPPGVRQFRKAFDVAAVPEKASLDISCDETFTVWLNGSELMANPSPHYTQRVFSIDVAKHLKAGHNVIAVQGTNQLDRLDPKFGTTAGLFAQITANEKGREVVLLKTDETWRCSDQAPEGWNRTEFVDKSWNFTRPWLDDNVTWPWKYAVWDSAVNPQLKPPLEPIKVVASGNVRDYKSWEGYPTLDSERVVIGENDLPKKSGDDATFLRYPSKHPLSTAGPKGVPVGAIEE
jgi:eukaryotic-like serine/threonine-protein kinase